MRLSHAIIVAGLSLCCSFHCAGQQAEDCADWSKLTAKNHPRLFINDKDLDRRLKKEDQTGC